MFLNSLLADPAKWYFLRFDSPLNAVRSVAIWLTLALLVAFIVCAALLKGEKRARFLKIGLISAVVYACLLGAAYLVLSFAEDGIKKILFIPLLVLLAAIAANAVALSLKRSKATYIAAGATVGAALIATLVCIGIYFASGQGATDSYLPNGNDDVNSPALYVCAALLIAAVVAAALFFGRKDKKGFDSKSVTYAAICIAMSFALSYLRIVKMPQGGSITIASLLPLMLYSFMFGTKKGVFAGLIYGVLQAFQDPAIVHPAQFLLDYPVAFACIGLSGMFAKTKALEKLPQVQFALGGVVAGLARLLMHFVSGIFAFGAFAPEGTPVALYSFLYQAGYVLPDIAIVIVAGVLVLSSKTFVKEVRKFNSVSETQARAENNG